MSYNLGPVHNGSAWEFNTGCTAGGEADAIRERFRALTLRSTLFCGWVIGFHDITTTIHAAMAAFIQRPSLTKLGLVPRDFLKTSLWTIADSVRLVSAFPEERILIRNEIEANAKKFLYRIRRVPEACELWQWLFPDRMPDFDEKWNNDGLLFPRQGDYPEVSVEAIGVGGASTSRHYTRIKEDDMIGKEAARSPATMEVAKDDHKMALHLLVDPNTDHIDTYGTRWQLHDLYQDMMEKEDGLDIFHSGPTAPDGSPLFPARFPLETLEKIRKKNGQRHYSLQVLNETPPEGFNELSPADLNPYSRHTDTLGRRFFLLHTPGGSPRTVYLHDLLVFQVVDPNISKNSQSSRTASITVGLAAPDTELGHFAIVLLSAAAKATDPKGALEIAREHYLFWSPLVMGMETVGAFEAYKQWMLTAYPDMMIKSLKPDHGESKLARIRGFSTFGANGHLYVHPSMTDFIDEWETFPNGQYMDLLDAMAYLPQVWTIPTFGMQLMGQRDPIRAMIGIEDAERVVAEDGRGRDQLTGY